MNETKYIAVVGLNEYRAEIDCENVRFLNESDSVDEYEFVIGRAETGLFLHTTKQRIGFVTICDVTTEKQALQALVHILSEDQIIGIDWNDIEAHVTPTVKFYSKIVNLNHCITETKDWIKGTLSCIAINRVCILLVYGAISILEVNEISEAFVDAFGDASDILIAFVSPKETNPEVQVSIWVNT